MCFGPSSPRSLTMIITVHIIHSHLRAHDSSESAECTRELNGFCSWFGRDISPEAQQIKRPAVTSQSCKFRAALCGRPWAVSDGHGLASPSWLLRSVPALCPFYRWKQEVESLAQGDPDGTWWSQDMTRVHLNVSRRGCDVRVRVHP